MWPFVILGIGALWFWNEQKKKTSTPVAPPVQPQGLTVEQVMAALGSTTDEGAPQEQPQPQPTPSSGSGGSGGSGSSDSTSTPATTTEPNTKLIQGMVNAVKSVGSLAPTPSTPTPLQPLKTTLSAQSVFRPMTASQLAATNTTGSPTQAPSVLTAPIASFIKRK